MKLNIKTTIGIIIIALSGISVAQAEQHRSERGHDRSADRNHSRNYERPRQNRNYRHNERRQHANRHNRNFRGHNNYRYDRHSRRHMRVFKRLHRGNHHYRGHQNRGNHYGWRNRHHTTYVAPRHPSHDVTYSTNHHSDNSALPVIAGTLIGSSIANDASNGDPVATFGGAVFGAIVGNAIAQH